VNDPIIVFDDGRAKLGPMGDLRAAFEVRTGMLTTAGRLAADLPGPWAGYWVPPRLEAVVAARANAPVNRMPESETVLCVSGRWALPDPSLRVELGEIVEEAETGDVVIARLRRAEAEYLLRSGERHERTRVRTLPARVLVRFPWDVVGVMKETIPHDLAATRILDTEVPTGRTHLMGSWPVKIDRTATIGPNVVLDAEAGAIVVHEHASIRPGAVLCGPCSVGPHSTVLDLALIKANTVIGPWCKVAGEVGSTIFQGFANKAHHGHLGDSWVGKWANLGAGTVNSNLLNTYGEVTMRLEPGGQRHRTGLTFLGSIVGDHVKTAIGTRLMTGTVLGTGSMIASTAPPPATVGRFAWLTDDGERLFRLEKFLEVMKTVMARRDRTPTPAMVEAVRDLHAMAEARVRAAADAEG